MIYPSPHAPFPRMLHLAVNEEGATRDWFTREGTTRDNTSSCMRVGYPLSPSFPVETNAGSFFGEKQI